MLGMFPIHIVSISYTYSTICIGNILGFCVQTRLSFLSYLTMYIQMFQHLNKLEISITLVPSIWVRDAYFVQSQVT